MHKIAEMTYSCGSAANTPARSAIFLRNYLKYKNKLYIVTD